MSGTQDSVSIIHSNLEFVWEKMAQAANRAQRPKNEIKLIVVTKGRSIDITKIHKNLGWAPRIDIKRGIQETIEWYKTTLSS